MFKGVKKDKSCEPPAVGWFGALQRAQSQQHIMPGHTEPFNTLTSSPYIDELS